MQQVKLEISSKRVKEITRKAEKAKRDLYRLELTEKWIRGDDYRTIAIQENISDGQARRAVHYGLRKLAHKISGGGKEYFRLYTDFRHGDFRYAFTD